MKNNFTIVEKWNEEKMLKLNNLKSSPGANRNTKRIGRGLASGQGKQAGKGHKGQKARKSGHVRIGFEGGSMPIYMRLPKKGFKNYPFKDIFAVVNFKQLAANKFDGNKVTREALIACGLLSGANKKRPIKILANGKLGAPLVFSGTFKFSKTALEQITAAGGKVLNENNI